MSSSEICCSCGFSWCFSCLRESHLPVACDTVKKWQMKNKSDEGDVQWIKLNTKPCPKCDNPIQKDGGCMHMTCRKPGGCGHEFCWVCLKPWNDHKICNAPPEDAWATQQRETAKHDLMRYAHYCERFLAHEKAEAFAATTQQAAVASIAESWQKLHTQSPSFLDEAVRQIISGRRFLKWTYVHGYFANYKIEERKFFEFHQAQLEGTLERLCDVMENTSWDDILAHTSERHVDEIRSQILSLTAVVREFFDKLKDAFESNTLLCEASIVSL